MSSGIYRVLTVFLNLGLIGLIVYVGLGIFRATEAPKGERVPKVNPPALAIEQNQAKSNTISEYLVVWQQLDVPKPVQVAPQPNRPAVAPPRPQDLSSRYKVRMVLIDDERPDQSQCTIASASGGGKGRTVEKGDKIDGYTILSIVADGADAVVTLDDNGIERKIRLRAPTQ